MKIPVLILMFATVASAADVSVWFSPNGGAEAAVCAAISKAKSAITVLAYSYTSEPIEAALVAAARRKVRVRIVVDRSQRTARGSMAASAARAGIEVRYDGRHAIAHQKVIVIDGREVWCGSFNWTKAAEHSNSEDLVRIVDPAIAAKYASNWLVHHDHSEKR